MCFTPQQNRHPERSASQIYRITKGLQREVEEPVLSVVEGTSATLAGRCCSEFFGYKAKKSQAPSEARDLRFYGPFVEMFTESNYRQRLETP